MKSEFRKSKSERIPKSKIRSIAPYPSRAADGRCLMGFLGAPGLPNVPTRSTLASGFGLRVSFGIRISDFGFVQSLVSPKPSIYDGSFPKRELLPPTGVPLEPELGAAAVDWFWSETPIGATNVV